MKPLTPLSWPLVFACFYFRQPIDMILSKNRKRKYARVRQVIQYIAYESGMTYQQAGELTGSDHNGARSNIFMIKNLIEPINGKIQDEKLRNDINILKN